MPIEYQDNIARFTDIVTVEEAEGLVAWLQEHKESQIVLSQCQHIHSACLQALLVFGLDKFLNEEELCQRQ